MQSVIAICHVVADDSSERSAACADEILSAQRAIAPNPAPTSGEPTSILKMK